MFYSKYLSLDRQVSLLQELSIFAHLLTAEDGSMITSSKDKVELYANTFSATLFPPANLPAVPEFPHRLRDFNRNHKSEIINKSKS